jgi:hypothetical protein
MTAAGVTAATSRRRDESPGTAPGLSVFAPDPANGDGRGWSATWRVRAVEPSQLLLVVAQVRCSRPPGASAVVSRPCPKRGASAWPGRRRPGEAGSRD